MKIQQFDGGVSSRLDPQFIAQNQGVIYENIDNAVGSLTPDKDKLDLEQAINQYFTYYRANDEWISSATKVNYLQFQSKLYTSDGSSIPTIYDGITTRLLGIAPPTNASVVSVDEEVPKVYAITAEQDDTAGNLPYSPLEYMVVSEGTSVNSVPYRFTSYSNGRATVVKTEPKSPTGRARNAYVNITVPNNRQVKLSQALTENYGISAATVYREYNGEWRKVGEFTAPLATSVITDNVYDISANALYVENTAPLDGTYQYVYTYYNSTNGVESAPSPVSNELEISAGTITVTLPSTSTDSQVTHKRLYRVGGDITQFTLVAELSAATTTYDDALLDSELDGRLLESDNYYQAPQGLQYLTSSYAMLFGALGSTLYFTPIGVPTAWPPEYSIEFEDEITGLGSVANGVLVMTRYSTFIITGTGPFSLAQQLLRGDQGCISFDSIQKITEGMLIWASEDGLCTSSGNNVISITKNMLGKVDLDPVSSAVTNEVYYCLNSDGTVLAYDYRFTPILKWLTLNVNSLLAANSTLYGHSTGKLYEMFKGSINLTFKYKSPRFIEGASTQQKTYKKFYFRIDGDIIINILINDVYVVTSKQLSGKDTIQVQVPQVLQRGNYVQFELEGTGKVLEYEYEAEKQSG